LERRELPVAAAAIAPATAASTTAATPAAESASSSAATAMTAPATASSFARRTRFVDDKIAAVEVLAIQGLHGLVGFLVILNFDEAKASRLTGEAVPDEGNAGRSNTCRRKPLGKIVLRRLKREIAHVELLHLLTPSARGRQFSTGHAEEADNKTRAV